MASLYSSILFICIVAFSVTLNVAAQSLPECAQSCVGSTRTKCQPTDYACACSDGKYMPKLTKCIDNFCEEDEIAQSQVYLTYLCQSAGTPLEFNLPEHLEARQNSFDVSYTPDPFPSPTFLPNPYFNGTFYNGTNGTTNGGGGAGGGSRKKKGSATVKISLGVAIPLVVIGIAALIFFLLKRAKKRKEAAMAAAAGQGAYNQEKQQAGGAVTGTPGAPAELSQGAMYTGHEMPTQQGNTAEMPAQVPEGYKDPGGVQGGQPQQQWPQAPQAAHSPQGQQQWGQGQPMYDQAAQSPPAQQYPQGQWVFVPHPQPVQGTPQYVPPVEAPAQPASPSELPGR